jgi:hypothetical protein
MRKIRITIWMILFIVLAAFLGSCGKTSIANKVSSTAVDGIDSTLPNNNDCIPALSSIGVIPIGVNVPKQIIHDTPPNGWELVGSLPKSASVYSFAVQNGNEIWISYWDDTDQIIRYRNDNGEKKFYSPNNNSIVLPASLFFSRDGTLWSKNYIGQNTASGVPLLSRYNESTDQFNVVVDNKGILQSPRELRSYIVEDSNGLFWMFLKDSTDYSLSALSLYSFNPNTLVIEKHPLQITSNFATIEIAIDSKSIWTVDQSKGELIQYFPSTHEIRPFNSLPSRGRDDSPISLTDVLKQPLYIYYDHSGRIWLDNEGWLDFTNPAHPGYYKLIPSPVFIGYFESPNPGYGWLETFGMFESSDGVIWFTTNGGVIRLDIRQGYQKGEWCLVTNGYSNIEEDNQQDLWMIVFDKIYKYHIQP